MLLHATLAVATYSIVAGAFRFVCFELRDRREQFRWLCRTGVRLAATMTIESAILSLLVGDARRFWCSGLRVALGVVGFGLTYAHNVAGRVPSTSSVSKRGAVLVTGSTAGIGFATAGELSRRGCVVVVPARDVTKAHKIAASIENAFAVDAPLELSDQASVRAYAKELRATLARRNMALTTLVLNAGVMRVAPELSVDGAELTIASNHLGHHTLATLLLPELRNAADLGYDCRIVVVTSSVHRLAAKQYRDKLTDFSPPLRFEMFKVCRLSSFESTIRRDAQEYARSKLANVLWTEELARRLEDKKISCISLHPGMVTTQVTRHLPLFIRISHALSMPVILPLIDTLDNPHLADHAIYSKNFSTRRSNYDTRLPFARSRSISNELRRRLFGRLPHSTSASTTESLLRTLNFWFKTRRQQPRSTPPRSNRETIFLSIRLVGNPSTAQASPRSLGSIR